MTKITEKKFNNSVDYILQILDSYENNVPYLSEITTKKLRISVDCIFQTLINNKNNIPNLSEQIEKLRTGIHNILI